MITKQNKVLKDTVDFLLCKRKRESKKKKKSPNACKRSGEKGSLGACNLRAEAGSLAPRKPQFEHLTKPWRPDAAHIPGPNSTN